MNANANQTIKAVPVTAIAEAIEDGSILRGLSIEHRRVLYARVRKTVVDLIDRYSLSLMGAKEFNAEMKVLRTASRLLAKGK